MIISFYIWLAAAMLLLLLFAVHRINTLDVKTGRRTGPDYGSNIGWYWPWSPMIWVCFFGFILCVLRETQ